MPRKDDSIGRLFVDIEARQAKLEKDLAGLKAKSESAAKGMEKSFKTSFKEIGKAAIGFGGVTAAVTLFTRAIGEAVRRNIAFSKAMRNVNSIMGLTEKQFKGMKREVADLARELGVNSVELADALYQAASAGVAAGDAIEFIRTATQAGIAGVTTTEVAVDGLTTVLNAFGKSSDQAGWAADIMFQTVKLGKTTFDQLAGSLAQVAPLAAASGVEFEEVSAAIATLTKQGTPTAQAVTQIRAALISMNDSLGESWSATMTFQEAAQEMFRRAGGSATRLKEEMGRVEGVLGVLALTGEKTAGAMDDLNQVLDAGGAQAEAYDEQMKSLDRRLEGIKNRMFETGGAGREAFSGILGLLITVYEWLEKAQSKLAEWIPALIILNKLFGDTAEKAEEVAKTLERPPTPEIPVADVLPEEDILGRVQIIGKDVFPAAEAKHVADQYETMKVGAREYGEEVARLPKATEDMVEETSALLEAGGNALVSSAFSVFFDGLVSKMRQSSNAVVQVVGAMVDSILAELSRMAAAELLSFLPGGGIISFLGSLFQHGGKQIAKAANGLQQQIQGAQNGFKVPFGFQNDQYPLLVESGENVSVTSRGRTSSQDAKLDAINQSIQALNVNMGREPKRGRGEKLDIGITGEIQGRDIRLSYDKTKQQQQRYT